jgi:hypothetical protein
MLLYYPPYSMPHQILTLTGPTPHATRSQILDPRFFRKVHGERIDIFQPHDANFRTGLTFRSRSDFTLRTPFDLQQEAYTFITRRRRRNNCLGSLADREENTDDYTEMAKMRICRIKSPESTDFLVVLTRGHTLFLFSQT